MFSHSQAQGLPTFTLDKGRKLGQLDEVIIDVGKRTIQWLRLRDRAWFGGGSRQWVPAGAVHGMGANAVIVADSAELTETPDMNENAQLIDARQDLLGKPVITEHGQRLGEVRDYAFSPEKMALTELYVSPRFNFTGQLETIPIENVLTLGENAVIVDNQAASLTAPKDEKPAEALPEDMREEQREPDGALDGLTR